MKTNLYQALGIDPYASQKEVKAALRALVRKYHQEALQGAGDAEEMLRFINQAYRVLGNEDSRAQYDTELATQPEKGLEPEIVREAEPVEPFVLNEEIPDAPEEKIIIEDEERAASPKLVLPKVRRIDQIIEAVKQSPRPQLWATKLRMPGVGGGFSKRIWLNIITLVVLIALVAWLPISLNNVVDTLKFFLTWITIAAVLAGIIYGSIWMVNRFLTRAKTKTPETPPPEMLTLDTDTSIFLGMDEPTAPASNVLKLNKVVKKTQTEPVKQTNKPWLRFSARLIDYGLWGLVVAGLLWLIEILGLISLETFSILTNPFVAPVLITFSWIFVETFLMYVVDTTPGKWLNNTRVNFNVSSSEDLENPRLSEIFMRSLRVWWRGVGCGVPILSLISLSISKQHLDRSHETSWDFDGDCLVSHGKLEPINGILMLMVLSLLLWIYGNAWRQPLIESLDRPKAILVHARASLSDGLSDLFISEQKIQTPAPVAVPEVEKPIEPKIEVKPEVKSEAKPEIKVEIKPTAKSLPEAKLENSQPAAQPASVAPSPKAKSLPNLKSQAEKLQRDGKWEELITLGKTWAEADAKNPQAWHFLGIGHHNMQQYKPAVSALEKAAKLAPQDKKIREDLVKSFHAQYGRHDQKEPPQ